MNLRGKVLLPGLMCLGALLLCGGGLSAQNKKVQGVQTVVIDAGHGGTDPGAVYGGVKEKDINLKVALKFGKLVADNCPEVKVVYTRTKDVFVGLADRGNIANKAGGNLFISLHADAASSSAKGAATFIMGLDKQENNLKEAMRENAVMKYEENYEEKYEGFDPTSAESYIIFSLMQYAYFNQSMLFAQTIQEHYKSSTAFIDRGARQGPYYVLWKPAMPSVLTEMGFLSNESDRKYINSDKGQNEIAKALFLAFAEYKQSVEKKESADRAALQAANETAVQSNGKASEAVSTVGFFVQLSASRTKIKTNDSRFGKYRGKVVEKQTEGWYKYCLGGYRDLEEAVKMRDEAKKNHFKDAFIVAFDGGEQITVDEARSRAASGTEK